ncbi:SpoIID/LytB domain-containing protein [Mediterraneibacter glycyrrhizinilyticus]|uniref:SpoIID/LytB domain-containing protein n=1 Tax=Mediterraneibacter glycyrrhizinilyticus TaxID=342942 RepID=UPI0025A4106D|nr:SpoIID/LytB domain-containing protein [Mediterraneibacter glycyrrhizinilyticus]MDM8126437.1 SpoIID/LytB domain-containing protein [Mediterraneibacter glycyrrhizinilyticus]
MNRYAVEQKFKSIAAFLIILILLPYIVSVFVNGADVREDDGENFYVKVKVPDAEEADGVTEIRWTDYLAGILAEEISEDCEPETLKAQAVVIRTQIYRTLEDSEDKTLTESYLSRNEMEDKWGAENYGKYYEKYVRAVEETDDTVVMYGDAYAWTPFHQSSNGMTRSAAEVLGSNDYPYIAVRECPLDKEADDEIQTFAFPYTEIQSLCRDFLVAEEDEDKAAQGYTYDDFEVRSCDSAGYVSELRIGNTICTGDQFRDALSLPSSAFSFSEEDDDNIKITTTGKGHGLGMSIWTADQMAKEGKTFEEILAFFFEGTELRNDIQETELF